MRQKISSRVHRNCSLRSSAANLRRFVVMDLLLGRVDRHHPLFSWFTSYGMSELDIDWLRANPQRLMCWAWTTTRTATGNSNLKAARCGQRRADNPVGLYGVATPTTTATAFR